MPHGKLATIVGAQGFHGSICGRSVEQGDELLHAMQLDQLPTFLLQAMRAIEIAAARLKAAAPPGV